MSNEENVFPAFQIEDRTFSKVLLGHNPFLGYSYLSKARAKEYADRFSDPSRIEAIIVRAIELGVRGMMLSTGNVRCERVVDALEAACNRTGVPIPTLIIVSRDFEEHLDLIKRANGQVALIHGQITDALYNKGARNFKPELDDLIRRIRSAGLVPAISTHNAGEVIPVAEPYDVAAVNTPINKIAWRMCPCEEMVLDAIRKTSKKVIAMKPLAMGRITPEDGMQYVLRTPDIDATVMGIATVEEVEETLEVCRTALS